MSSLLENKLKPNAGKVELAVYAIASLALIGHVFVVPGPISGVNVALILLGAVFGLIFATGTTPFANLVTRDGEASVSADVFPFIQNTNKPRDVDERRAA